MTGAKRGVGRPRLRNGEETERVNIRLPESVMRAVRAAARERGVTPSTVLRELVERWAARR